MQPGPSPLFLCGLVPASSSAACPWGAWIPLRGQKSGSSSGQPSPAPRKPAGQCRGTQLPLPAWTGCPPHPHALATSPWGLGPVSLPPGSLWQTAGVVASLTQHPPFSAHPALRGATLSFRAGTSRLGLSQWQGPGGQLPGDRSGGGLLSRERTPGETPPPFESCDCALGSGSQTRNCPGSCRSPLSMASRTSIPSVVIAVPRSKNTLKMATAKRLSPRGACPTRAGSQGLTRILSGLPGGPLSLPVTLLLPQRGMQRGTETCPRPHGTERGALAPPRPAPFLNGLPVRPPASRHRPVVQSPRTSTSNQKPGAGGRGRSVSLSLVLSSGLAQRRP